MSEFVVFRRDLPGGRIVMLSLHVRGPEVVGRLQVERRSDPARREGGHQPPTIAEVRGESREAVLAELRRIAENDDEVTRKLDEWQRGRASSAATHRVRMDDGALWTVVRRHEMTQLQAARGLRGERRLFVFFTGPGGALRRAEVPEGFPSPEQADERELRAAWERAEILQPPA